MIFSTVLITFLLYNAVVFYLMSCDRRKPFDGYEHLKQTALVLNSGWNPWQQRLNLELIYDCNHENKFIFDQSDVNCLDEFTPHWRERSTIKEIAFGFYLVEFHDEASKSYLSEDVEGNRLWVRPGPPYRYEWVTNNGTSVKVK